MRPEETYQLLRNLTSPVVAITCERGGKRNGMISDSAVRASIVPAIPRVSVYIHKFNLSHDLIYETGRFALHLLRNDQFELIKRLGFTSGRARDKLADVPHHTGTLGVPVLDECYAHFECRVANVMRSEEHTSELQSQSNLVCRLLLEKKNTTAHSSGIGTSSSISAALIAAGSSSRTRLPTQSFRRATSLCIRPWGTVTLASTVWSSR